MQLQSSVATPYKKFSLSKCTHNTTPSFFPPAAAAATTSTTTPLRAASFNLQNEIKGFSFVGEMATRSRDTIIECVRVRSQKEIMEVWFFDAYTATTRDAHNLAINSFLADA